MEARPWRQQETRGGPRDRFGSGRPVDGAILAWRGEPDDPETESGGVGWIRAVEWMPYQASNFVTPPFPGYTSGHSTFSRAGAEVLAAFTGSDYFPGGMGRFAAHQNEYLEFENGPSDTVELQWATYADAADEAGLSRRYGGIHPWYDDFPGRVQGKEIGLAAFDRALTYYNRNLQGKPYLCHVPPGNPDRRRTLTIADEAVAAHLAHGDSLGRCEDREEADEAGAAEREPSFSPVEPLGKGPALAGPHTAAEPTRAPRGVGKGKRIDQR